jgi:hypothetical protein
MDELADIMLADIDLNWDAYLALENCMPGIEALVRGHGNEVVITQDLVDQLLDIWLRLKAAASPEMAADIQAELDQYNQLQDFVDTSFDTWAKSIGVIVPETRVPEFERYR